MLWLMLLCLLLGIAAALLGALYLIQRRELAAVEALTSQIDAGEDAGPIEDLPPSVTIETDDPQIWRLARGINRLLARAQGVAPSSTRREIESVAAATPVDLFAELADRSREVVVVHGERILFANLQFAQLVGVERESLLGRALADVVAPEFTDFTASVLERARRGEPAPERFEIEIIGLQAQLSRLELRLQRTRYGDQDAVLVTGVEIVQTAQVPALSQRLYAQEAALPALVGANREEADGRGPELRALALDSLNEAVIVTDAEGVVRDLNGAAQRLLGVDRGTMLGQGIGAAVRLIDEVDQRPVADPVSRALASGGPVVLGRRVMLAGTGPGSDRLLEVSASPMRAPDGEIAGVAVMLHDVTEQRGVTRQLSYQATHDALTGLVNRREFEHRLDEAISIARRGDATHVLCYVDLDGFKAVNDASGHLGGDALLRDVARRLREAVRDSDTVARLGGDEFALLLMGCPLDKARQIADDVTRSIGEQRFVWKDRVHRIGASVGIVEIARETGGAEEALAAADSACYVAKRQGIGGVAVYSARDEALARTAGDFMWLQKLQTALRDQRFQLYLQPIVPATSTVPDGPAAEVLVRLIDEAGRVVSPGEFQRAAERYRLMSHVDRIVVQKSLEAIANGTIEVPPGRCIALNVAGQTLGDVEFLEFVVDAFDRTGVSPTQLCFEMTESAVVNNLEHARRFVDVLHGLGCKFSLDDFGSGVGSFSNLRQLPVDYLKIDGTFTRNLGRDTVNEAMVTAMMKLARTLNFRVIAEQVEDAAALDAARRMGIDFLQGYAIARPQPLRAT